MTKKSILDPRGLHPPIRRVEADRLQNLKTPFSPVIVSRVTPFRLKSSLLTFALTSNTMDAFNEEDLKMYFYENRLKTFNGWPFEEGCSCTPENMAKAGFIHTPSENGPDVAMCFFCLKELEGWEPEDDPQKEHKSHSPSCHFINLKKKVEELTVEEFFKLQKERHKSMINKSCNEAITRFEEAAKLRRADIIKTATGEE